MFHSGRQVTFDEQLQAYVFTDTNALILAENQHVHVIFAMNQQKEILDIIQRLRQFRQVRAEECDWTT